MRAYSQVESRFWTAGSGKALRGKHVAQLVALYLMTAPGANMVGIYYLPLPTLAHEVGLGVEEARAALREIGAVGIAEYDEAEELVYLPRMAAKQVGESLRPNDKRIGAIARMLEPHGDHRFVRAFHQRYGLAFNLPDAPSKPDESPLGGPSQPLRSQDQDQDQDQDQEQEQEQEQEQDLPHTPLGGSSAATVHLPTKPPRSKRAQGAGSRIAPDWRPTPATLETFLADGVDAAACVPEFVDYWAGVPDPKGRKADWDATFRNRVRQLVAAGRAPAPAPTARLRPVPPAPEESFDAGEERAPVELPAPFWRQA